MNNSLASLSLHTDKDKDGKITLEEWIELGKEAGLVKELLGTQFLEVMQHFDPSHADKELKRKHSVKKKGSTSEN